MPWTAALLPADRLRFFAGDWPTSVAVQLAGLYFLGFYDPPRPRGPAEIARGLAGATLLSGLALAGYHFLADRAFPRSVLLLFVVLDFLLLLAWRLALGRPDRRRARRVAIIGTGDAAKEIAAAIARHRDGRDGRVGRNGRDGGHGLGHGLVVAGFVPVPEEEDESSDTGASPDPFLGPCLGRTADLPRLLAEGIVDDIILASPTDSWQTRLIDGLAGSRPDHSNVLLLPGPFESLIGRMRYRSLQDLPLIEVVRESEWRINRPAKRCLDLVLGIFLAVLSLPLLLAGALAVRLTSPGAVFYRQVRIGRDRRPFTLWKLRTMRLDAEASGDEMLAREGDPRLTAAGAFLRKARLDEIPQLWNVLVGDMSLVGPRPERPGFVERFLAEVPGYAERFSLVPGLTGLAQVNGDYHSSPRNKLRYELAYMGNWSLWLDLVILVRTVKIVLTSRGV